MRWDRVSIVKDEVARKDSRDIFLRLSGAMRGRCNVKQ
jgi:hypothetical protein